MSHVPHELAEEFPAHVDRIARLKAEWPRFAKLADRYHEVNRSIHRSETNLEPHSDAHDIEMRRERMRLKDEIAGMLVERQS
ncbi:MAG: DUF465 domain-containing protein [Pseudomonadota bacterium]